MANPCLTGYLSYRIQLLGITTPQYEEAIMARSVGSEEHARIKGKEQNTQKQGTGASFTGKIYKGPAAGKAPGGKARKGKKAY